MIPSGRGRRLLAQHPAELCGEHRGPFGAAAPQDHAELLPAVAADHVAGPHVRAEHVRDVEQDLIADGLPETLVDPAEPVQVEDHERQRPAVPPAVLHRVLQLGHERGVVQQAGELVPVQHLTQPAAALGPADDGLEQQLAVNRVGRRKSSAPARRASMRSAMSAVPSSTIGSRPKRGSCRTDRAMVNPSAVREPRTQEQQVRHLAVEQLLDGGPSGMRTTRMLAALQALPRSPLS